MILAKEKLLGEEVVNEVLGVVTATPKVMTKAKQVRARKQLIQNVKTKAKEYGSKAKEYGKKALFGTSTKGKIVRAAAGGTAAYMMGRKDEAGANIDRNLKLGSLERAGFVPKTKIKPLSSDSVKYEETMLEDKKMSKQSDDALAAAHKKFSGMDQSTPSNKFMLKRIEKEMKKRKTVKEGSAYGIYKGDGVMKIGKKEEEKAPRKQKGAMAYDGPNKERSEAADRVLAKAKKKREKMKEEYVGEAKMKMKAKPKNPKDMSKGVGQAAPVDYRTLAQSYSPVGNIFNEKKLDAVGAEDKDIDNDGDHDSTDKYLLKRRKAISKAIAKKRGRVKEGFSAWRIDLDFNEQVKK